MWNPEAYRDTDFGLGDNETFEPVDDQEPAFEPAPGEPFVQTILGPVPPEELGVTLVHEHLQWAPPVGHDADVDNRLDDPRAALLDLEALFTVSGRAIVSATPAVAGRDAGRLLWLAQHAPVHIVAATGFHTGDYLARQYAEDAEEQMRADLERDLTEGMDGTSSLPGVVTLATSQPAMTPLESHAVELAADASRRIGLPVEVQPADGAQAVDLIDRLAGLGVSSDHIVVGHAGSFSKDAMSSIVDAGAYLLFDQIGMPDRGPDAQKAQSIARLFEQDRGGQVLISHGYARRSLLTGYGGRPGLPYVVEQFAVMLLEAGLEALDVRRMLVDNPARAISVRKPDIAARA